MKIFQMRIFPGLSLILLVFAFVIAGCISEGSVPPATPIVPESTSIIPDNTVSPTPVVITFKLNRQDVKFIEKETVIYFLFDNSGSVTSCCLDGARKTIDVIDFMVNSISTLSTKNLESDFGLSVGVGKFSSETQIVSDICAISEFPGECKNQFRQGFVDLKDDLNNGSTDFYGALEFAKASINTYAEKNGGIDNFEKIIVFVTDGDVPVQQIYEQLNREQQQDEFVIFYGLYPGVEQEKKYDEAEIILKCKLLPNDINEWPRILFEQIKVSDNLGWADSEPVQVFLDDCAVNRFLGLTQNIQDELILQYGENLYYENSLIPSQGKGNYLEHNVFSTGSLGLYWIKTYRPELNLSLTTFPIVLHKEGNDSVSVRLEIKSAGKEVEIDALENCFYPTITDTEAQPIISATQDKLIFDWKWNPQSDFCDTHYGGELSVNDNTEIQILSPQQLEFPVQFKPGVYAGGKIEVSYLQDQQTPNSLDLITLDVPVFEPVNSNPLIYLLKDQKLVALPTAVTVPSPEKTEYRGRQCPWSEQKISELELAPVRIQDVIPVEPDDTPINLLGYSKKEGLNCMNQYVIKTFRSVVENAGPDDCGFSEILFIWDGEMNKDVIPTAIRCSIDMYNLTISECVEDITLLTIK